MTPVNSLTKSSGSPSGCRLPLVRKTRSKRVMAPSSLQAEKQLGAVTLTGLRLAERGQPDLVDFLLPQPGPDDHGRRDALSALVHDPDDLERAGAVGLLPTEGPGVPAVPPADFLAGRR